MTPAQGDTASREVLEQLLREHNSGSYRLPPLAPGADPFEPIKKILRYIWAEIDSYLRRFQPKSSNFQISPEMLETLAWLAIAIIAAIVLYQVVKFLLPFARGLGRPRITGHTAEAATDSLDGELVKAESEGEFARALRIRWRLFLRHKSLGSSITPDELLLVPPVESPELSNALNAAMFDALELSDRNRYTELKESVTELEGWPK